MKLYLLYSCSELFPPVTCITCTVYACYRKRRWINAIGVIDDSIMEHQQKKKERKKKGIFVWIWRNHETFNFFCGRIILHNIFCNSFSMELLFCSPETTYSELPEVPKIATIHKAFQKRLGRIKLNYLSLVYNFQQVYSDAVEVSLPTRNPPAHCMVLLIYLSVNSRWSVQQPLSTNVCF